MPVSLTVLGSGTSHGVPMIGCDCAVCTSADPRDRRTRTSVVFHFDDRHVLIDTSPELRLQCVACNIRHIDAILFTHHHADHICGLDDVRRFNWIAKRALDVYANAHTLARLKQSFDYCFTHDPDYPSAKPELRPVEIGVSGGAAGGISGDASGGISGDASGGICGGVSGGVSGGVPVPFELFGRVVTPIRYFHGPLPVFGYRIGRIAYCTDISHMPVDARELLLGLDVLILGALRRRPHPTHFNLDQAVEEATRIGAKRTYFTHIAHELPHAATNAELPAGMELAFDGLVCREENR